MRLKYFILLTFFCVISTLAGAQDSSTALRFSTKVIDLGTIAEGEGTVVAYVEATNISSIPIYIDDIVTSCGCTKTSYPREAIAPHNSATIAITFDPFNRPGRIDKEIIVKVKDSDKDILLSIIGYVQPRERSIEEIYPFDMGGGLRLHATSRALGYLEHGKVIEEYIEFINTSQNSITLTTQSISSSGALEVIHPATLSPNQTGDITIRYTIAEDSDTYGTLSDIFYLVIDGTPSRYKLSAEAIAVDNFDLIDDISAPKGAISKNIIKFGEVNSPKAKLSEVLTISNDGGSVLHIRAVESSSEAIMCNILGDGNIPQGGDAKIAITLDCSKIDNPDELFTARIRIITSDPLRPMQSIKITAIPLW